MIKLNDLERDALVEICNVGVSKAAKQLSNLLGSRIDISIPEINFLTEEEISKDKLFSEEVLLSYVYQSLTGDLNGKALIIFQREHTVLLTQTVIDKAPKMTEKEIRACEQDAMLEIGNIIISACASAIVNMLSCHMQLTVPKYGEDKFIPLIQSQVVDIETPSTDIILMATKLDASGENISGKLLLILTVDSIQVLLDNLKLMLGE